MQTHNQSLTREADHKSSTKESPLVQVKKKIYAPVERAFEAWANPGLMQEWAGPFDFICPTAKIDFRVGGKYLINMRSLDGKRDIWSTGRYEVIQKNRKIICVDHPANADGEIIQGDHRHLDGPFADHGETYISVEFKELQPNACLVILSHEGLPARMHESCVDGWSEALDKMQRVVEGH